MAPAIPIATYRLQLTGAFGFRRRRDASCPICAALGISHVYASPILQARAGSTHGYDMVDPTRLNPELGGDDGFARADRGAARRRPRADRRFRAQPHGRASTPTIRGGSTCSNGAGIAACARRSTSTGTACRSAARPSVLAPDPRPPLRRGARGRRDRAALRRRARAASRPGTSSIACRSRRRAIAASCAPSCATPARATRDAGRALLTLAHAQARSATRPATRPPPSRRRSPRIAGGADDHRGRSRGLSSGEPRSGAARAASPARAPGTFASPIGGSPSTQINYRRFFDINSLAGLRSRTTATFEAVHARIAPLIAEGAIDGPAARPHRRPRRSGRLLCRACTISWPGCGRSARDAVLRPDRKNPRRGRAAAAASRRRRHHRLRVAQRHLAGAGSTRAGCRRSTACGAT